MEGYGEQGYLDALRHVLAKGNKRTDRTGTNTISVFGSINLEFDLLGDDGKLLVPIPSSKDVRYKAYMHELIWMLSGSTSVRYLLENGVNIWNDWVIPGTEKKTLLMYADRIRLAEKKGLLDDLYQFRNQLKDRDDWGALDKWLTDKGIESYKLVDGELGPVYGAQWRNWEDLRNINPGIIYNGNEAWEKYGKRGFKHVGELDNGELVIHRSIDQIAQLERALLETPDSRRMILSAWNVSRLDEMALPPCHTLAQWYVRWEEQGPTLDCKLYQRSGDLFLGVPFNFGFYSVMTHMLAHVHGFVPGKMFHTFGDAHIYSNHIEQVNKQLSNGIIEDSQPHLTFKTKPQSIVDFKFHDMAINGYKHHAFISAPVAV